MKSNLKNPGGALTTRQPKWPTVKVRQTDATRCLLCCAERNLQQTDGR